ncbi:MAG: glycerol-3-phosphate acyltransferase, partial [Phycisphaeraceae bacterium]
AVAALAWLSIAAAAVAGHIFPLWLRLRGGKGVATGLGAVLGLWPVVTLPGLAAGVIWLAVVKASGYVSLASMSAAVALPVLTLLSALLLDLSAGEVAVYTAVTALLAGLVVLRHRSNIAKLRAGTEPRVAWAGKKAES